MNAGCVKAAFAYGIGIYAASQVDLVFVLLFAACFGAVVFIRRILKKRVSGTMVLVVAAAIAGMAAYHFASDARLQEIGVLEEKYVTLEGAVTELPEVKEDGLYSYIMTTVRTERI